MTCRGQLALSGQQTHLSSHLCWVELSLSVKVAVSNSARPIPLEQSIDMSIVNKSLQTQVEECTCLCVHVCVRASCVFLCRCKNTHVYGVCVRVCALMCIRKCEGQELMS